MKWRTSCRRQFLSPSCLFSDIRVRIFFGCVFLRLLFSIVLCVLCVACCVFTYQTFVSESIFEQYTRHIYSPAAAHSLPPTRRWPISVVIIHMLFYSATGAKRPQGFLPLIRSAALPPRQQNNTLSPDAPRRRWRKLCLAKYKEATLMKLWQYACVHPLTRALLGGVRTPPQVFRR